MQNRFLIYDNGLRHCLEGTHWNDSMYLNDAYYNHSCSESMSSDLKRHQCS
jgi:hypothetical protein